MITWQDKTRYDMIRRDRIRFMICVEVYKSYWNCFKSWNVVPPINFTINLHDWLPNLRFRFSIVYYIENTILESSLCGEFIHRQLFYFGVYNLNFITLLSYFFPSYFWFFCLAYIVCVFVREQTFVNDKVKIHTNIKYITIVINCHNWLVI